MLIGGSGNDVLAGRGGDDELFGYNGEDAIYGGRGTDFLKGGGGSDILYSRDRVADADNCGNGDDTALADSLDGFVADPFGDNTCEHVKIA